MPHKFTKRWIEDPARLPEPGAKDRKLYDEVQQGLGLRVTRDGARVFFAQWTDPRTRTKKRERIGLYPEVTIESARRQAAALRGAVSLGSDPVAERKAKQAAVAEQRRTDALTLEALIGEWDRKHLSHRRETYRRDMVARIKRTLPNLLTRPAASLTRADVMGALDAARKGKHLAKTGEDGVAPRRADQSRDALIAATVAGCRSMFNWAVKADLVTANPFHNLPLAPVKAERDRWLNADELGAVYAAAEAMPYPFGPFVRLLVLTGQRLREVAGMRWSEIDLDRCIWTMPADRQKNGKPHVVHLSSPAQTIMHELAAVRGSGDFVFTTTGITPISGFSFAKADLDARSGVTEWAFHDLRRTLATGMADLGVSVEVAGKILAHKAGIMRGVDRVYQRSEFLEPRRSALEAWGVHVIDRATKTKEDGGVRAGAGRTAYEKQRAAKRTISGNAAYQTPF